MGIEQDRIIAELLGETDHLKKWCKETTADGPLELCIEDPGETQRPEACLHLKNGGCWDNCKSKATIDPPSFSTDDSAAWRGIKALCKQAGLIAKVCFYDDGLVDLDFIKPSNKPMTLTNLICFAYSCEGLAAAFADAMVKEIEVCTDERVGVEIPCTIARLNCKKAERGGSCTLCDFKQIKPYPKPELVEALKGEQL